MGLVYYYFSDQIQGPPSCTLVQGKTQAIHVLCAISVHAGGGIGTFKVDIDPQVNTTTSITRLAANANNDVYLRMLPKLAYHLKPFKCITHANGGGNVDGTNSLMSDL
jgi:hypothetical protein